MKDTNVIILGAGISGLVCAIELEKKGYRPTLIDQNNFVGGRVTSTFFNSTPLDLGFQVLLTAYPEAQKYLDYDALDLKFFSPGAVLCNNGEQIFWGDPLRDSSFLFSTIFSDAATFGDKLKVLKLKNYLKSKSIDSIFASDSKATMHYLQSYGFSDKIIKNFFQPFFAGIFLEEKLETSSRMFEFVFKLFGEGNAAIPAKGMQAIALQLKSKLAQTNFILGKTIDKIEDTQIILTGGESLLFDRCICTFDRHQKTEWHSCENLYFSCEKSVFSKPIIGLFTHEDRWVNNFHFVNDILDTDSEEMILSVTVIREHNLSLEDLVENVKKELKQHLAIVPRSLIKYDKINQALPNPKNLIQLPKSLQQIGKVIYTGDYVAQGSINSAMAVGRMAAEMI